MLTVVRGTSHHVGAPVPGPQLLAMQVSTVLQSRSIFSADIFPPRPSRQCVEYRLRDVLRDVHDVAVGEEELRPARVGTFQAARGHIPDIRVRIDAVACRNRILSRPEMTRVTLAVGAIVAAIKVQVVRIGDRLANQEGLARAVLDIADLCRGIEIHHACMSIFWNGKFRENVLSMRWDRRVVRLRNMVRTRRQKEGAARYELVRFGSRTLMRGLEGLHHEIILRVGGCVWIVVRGVEVEPLV